MAVCLILISVVMASALGMVAPLANCPTSCQCDDATLVVRCGEGNLDVLPIALNPSIQRLIITYNKIKTIDSSIQFYAELNFLDLSNNHLFNIPARTFSYQKKLQELYLNNNKIGSISNRTFAGLSTLTVLNLRENFLNELNAGIFSTLPKLEEINIGANRIDHIDSKAFEGLTNLRVLYLDDNVLTAVPSTSFGQLPRLAELYLGINSFTFIAKGSFENMPGLESLNIRGAGLFNISLETFRGLAGLRFLDLSDNRLQRIPTTELSTLTRLEELSLGQNDFAIVPEDAFIRMTNLRRLDITGSLKLTTLKAGAFATNTNLESLTISSNKALVEVQEGTLRGLPNLKHVILKDNAITTLTEGLFPWNELQTFDISENPIICDCRVMWLQRLLIQHNTSQSQWKVTCNAPDRLREEYLHNLSAEILGCGHIDPRRQAIIGMILVGSTAFITTLLLITYKCHRKIREILKRCWGNSVMVHKEREYHKTFSDDEFISRRQHPYSLSVYPTMNNNYPHNHPGIQSFPSTNL